MTKSVCPGITFFPENMESYVSILRLLDIIKPIRFLSKKQKQLVLQIAVCNPCLKLCRGKNQTKKSCCFPKCSPRHSTGPQETLKMQRNTCFSVSVLGARCVDQDSTHLREPLSRRLHHAPENSTLQETR